MDVDFVRDILSDFILEVTVVVKVVVVDLNVLGGLGVD